MANTNMCAALMTAGPDPCVHTHALMECAVTTLLNAGARDASLRADITSADALHLVAGLASAAQHSTKEQAHRLIDLFMDALTAKASLA